MDRVREEGLYREAMSLGLERDQLNEQLQIQASLSIRSNNLPTSTRSSENVINSIPYPSLRALVKRSFGEVSVIGWPDLMT